MFPKGFFPGTYYPGGYFPPASGAAPYILGTALGRVSVVADRRLVELAVAVPQSPRGAVVADRQIAALAVAIPLRTDVSTVRVEPPRRESPVAPN